MVREVLAHSRKATKGFELAHGWTGVVVDAPGANLSKETQRAIYEALVPVTSASFGADMTEYWRDRSANDYFGRLSEFVLIADGGGQMVGWTGYSVLDRSSYVNVYIDSSGVVSTGQSQGVMRMTARHRLTEGVLARLGDRERVYVSARSESPVFYKLMRGIVGQANLFPNPGHHPPGHVLECGRELAEWLGQEALLEPGSLVIRNAYAMLDELYGSLPATGDPAIDAMFRNSLGPLDAYLLIGVVDRARHGTEAGV